MRRPEYPGNLTHPEKRKVYFSVRETVGSAPAPPPPHYDDDGPGTACKMDIAGQHKGRKRHWNSAAPPYLMDIRGTQIAPGLGVWE